ncbi:YbaN family protein [Desulfococcaceae bacterium HSG9]|nr:YbaN family protein [Desulfococcaceae bacterium HSG9]
MKKFLQNNLLIILGWFFVILGAIGVILPILPTTPFLIVALAFFSKSSPRFHQMLLNNVWFGPTLKQWEDKKTLSRKIKYKAFLLIIITFSISVAILDSKIQLQLLLVGIAIILLFFIWRIKEDPLVIKRSDHD